MRNARQAYQAQLPNKHKVIKQVGIRKNTNTFQFYIMIVLTDSVCKCIRGIGQTLNEN